MPTKACEGDTWGYGGGATIKVVAVLLIMCLCTTVVAQRCYYQRRMKLLRDALKSDHQVEMSAGGPDRRENYVEQRNEYDLAARGSNVQSDVEVQLDVVEVPRSTTIAK